HATACHQGPSGPGSGTRLRPGAGAMSADRRDTSALPSAVWAVGVLWRTGGVTDGAGAGGAAPEVGPPGPRSRAPPRRPRAPRTRLVGAWRAGLGPNTPGAGRCPLRPPEASLLSRPLPVSSLSG